MVGADHDFGFSNEFLSRDPFHMAIQVAFVGALRFIALAIEVVHPRMRGSGSPGRFQSCPLSFRLMSVQSTL